MTIIVEQRLGVLLKLPSSTKISLEAYLRRRKEYRINKTRITKVIYTDARQKMLPYLKSAKCDIQSDITEVEKSTLIRDGALGCTTDDRNIRKLKDDLKIIEHYICS